MDYRTKPGSPEELLVHFGVKGMKWGERRAHRQNMRSLNKASRARDKAADDAAVDRARARVASGKTHAHLKAAKVKFKADKNVIGRREAGKVLAKSREKANADIEKSNQLKSGKETTTAVLAIIGTVGVATAINTAVAIRRL